jgi:hypothetical protein
MGAVWAKISILWLGHSFQLSGHLDSLVFQVHRPPSTHEKPTSIVVMPCDAQIVDDPDNDPETVKFLQRGLVRYEASLAELQDSRKRLAEEIDT